MSELTRSPNVVNSASQQNVVFVAQEFWRTFQKHNYVSQAQSYRQLIITCAPRTLSSLYNVFWGCKELLRDLCGRESYLFREMEFSTWHGSKILKTWSSWLLLMLFNICWWIARSFEVCWVFESCCEEFPLSAESRYQPLIEISSPPGS